MDIISKDICKEHLEEWLKAELAVTKGQSYNIGSRSLTRANLSEIRNTIDYWQSKYAQAENVEKNKGISRVRRVIPRDL